MPYAFTIARVNPELVFHWQAELRRILDDKERAEKRLQRLEEEHRMQNERMRLEAEQRMKVITFLWT